MNVDDDEIKRQLYTEQIKWWIKQSEEDIIALKGFLIRNKIYIEIIFFLDEVKLIQFSKDPFPTQNNNIPSTNKLPIDGPFTIVTTKDRLYKEAVGGAGYPR